MSRPALAAELAGIIEREVVPALAEALAHLDQLRVDISSDDPTTGHILGAASALDSLAHRLASAQVKALLGRAGSSTP
jgi:hypothetical protein